MDRMLQNKILREHLITLCRRSARNFRRISEATHERELKRVFRLFSQQRHEFVEELLQCGFPVDDNSETEAFRAFQNYRELPDMATGMKECAEKEQSLSRVYSDALDIELSDNLRELINRQKVQIDESLEYIQIRLHRYSPEQHDATSSVRW